MLSCLSLYKRQARPFAILYFPCNSHFLCCFYITRYNSPYDVLHHTLIAVNLSFSFFISSSYCFGFLTVPRVTLAPQARGNISEKACTLTASFMLASCQLMPQSFAEKHLQASLPCPGGPCQAALQENQENHWSFSMTKSRNKCIGVALLLAALLPDFQDTILPPSSFTVLP